MLYVISPAGRNDTTGWRNLNKYKTTLKICTNLYEYHRVISTQEKSHNAKKVRIDWQLDAIFMRFLPLGEMTQLGGEI